MEGTKNIFKQEQVLFKYLILVNPLWHAVKVLRFLRSKNIIGNSTNWLWFKLSLVKFSSFPISSGRYLSWLSCRSRIVRPSNSWTSDEISVIWLDANISLFKSTCSHHESSSILKILAASNYCTSVLTITSFGFIELK